MTAARSRLTGGSVDAARERRDFRRPSRHPVHLHADLAASERLPENSIVNGPAPAADRGLAAPAPERRRPVETGPQLAVGLKPGMDAVHAVPPHEVIAPVPLIEQRRV